MTTAILYHAGCPDGFAAAWVARTSPQFHKDTDVTFHPVTYNQPPPDVEADMIYILDFSYPPDQLDAWAAGRDVMMLDHHQTAIDAYKGLRPGVEIPGNIGWVIDPDRSGAGITWDWLHGNDEPRPPLVDYVEDRDLWRFALPRSKEVNAYIRTLPHDFIIWGEVNTMLTAGDMADAGKGALAHINAYVRAVAQHSYWCKMGGREFPIVNVAYESASEVANELLEKHGSAMAGYFFQRGDGTWQYGFRARKGTTVHKFAAQFGGGGHPQAAGCTSPVIAHTAV